jgi:hypothetical protein
LEGGGKLLPSPHLDNGAAVRSWNQLAVIAHEDDHATILNHALLQARRRGDL